VTQLLRLFRLLPIALGLFVAHPWMPTALAEPPRAGSLLESVPTPAPVFPGDAKSIKPGRFVFYEDFERGQASMKKWVVSGDRHPIGWHLLNASTCGGLFTLAVDRSDHKKFHAEKAGQSVVTYTDWIDLRKAKKPYLKYDVKGLLSPEDAVTVTPEASRDGKRWTAIGPTTLARYKMMRSRLCELAPYAGGRFRLRFRAEWKPFVTPTAGFYVDDVHIVEPS
jgi:hypothetical protein